MSLAIGLTFDIFMLDKYGGGQGGFMTHVRIIFYRLCIINFFCSMNCSTFGLIFFCLYM
jgi:hypothetical protein